MARRRWIDTLDRGDAARTLFPVSSGAAELDGELTPARIDQIARQSGIDVPRMRRAMGDEEIVKLLQDTYALATDLAGSPATPTFLINGQVISGADEQRLNARLREATMQGRTRATAER